MVDVVVLVVGVGAAQAGLADEQEQDQPLPRLTGGLVRSASCCCRHPCHVAQPQTPAAGHGACAGGAGTEAAASADGRQSVAGVAGVADEG